MTPSATDNATGGGGGRLRGRTRHRGPLDEAPAMTQMDEGRITIGEDGTLQLGAENEGERRDVGMQLALDGGLRGSSPGPDIILDTLDTPEMGNNEED
ncbi:hypothetical protein NDU88_006444 [Pleurodeles waltl]|uniref:Uncharacterized protein n=1 Tax=Pleurodeles waltl TaxID=8319 RepID=A0AAV7TYC1_PLEWA|nr:hypothetical protein NDU88_006444 [Pleurodeles waltl]